MNSIVVKSSVSANKVVFESNELLGLHLCVGKVHVIPVYKIIYSFLDNNKLFKYYYEMLDIFQNRWR